MLDLHTHTTYSDGTLTPSQLVKAALAAGVQALAITDHDTLAGWDEAIVAAGAKLEIVPGVELSTVENGRSLHILGFYPDRAALEPPLLERIAGRQRRAAMMVENLAALGYPIELSPMAENRALGRPHLAAALVQAGYAATIREAFDRWLGDHGPAYVPYDPLSAAEGLQLLRDCGAVPVWAHPYLFRGGTVETMLPQLLKAGLMGIEVYHPNHSPSEVRRLEDYCHDYGLLMTGGSDYHGPNLGDNDIGDNDSRYAELNQHPIPLTLLPPLKQAASSRSPSTPST